MSRSYTASSSQWTLRCFILLTMLPWRSESVGRGQYTGTHGVCTTKCAVHSDPAKHQGCMLGCRDYIEQAMYRPRVHSALPSSKQDSSLAETTVKTSSAAHPSSVEQDSTDRRRALDQLNVTPDGYSSDGDNVDHDATSPDSFKRTYRRHRFVRIGKKFGDQPQTAEEDNDGPEKRVPPGALYSGKRRLKFVRIGRKHRFVRIGKNSDTASAAA